jgi:hypothetical protein
VVRVHEEDVEFECSSGNVGYAFGFVTDSNRPGPARLRETWCTSS